MLVNKPVKAITPITSLPKDALKLDVLAGNAREEAKETLGQLFNAADYPREALIARIAFLEAGRDERKAERKRNRKRKSYFKVVSRTNEQFNMKFRGSNKGLDNVQSANLPADQFAEKRVASKWGWSKRNGKREWKGE